MATIFKAVYSGVPVWEYPCKGVAVMKRRSDNWVNATQILKVAGFDKPQRTRVLEREVQKGTHEKVQGGYGKYQGTWVPLDRGIAVSQQYGVDHLLKPIFDFTPTSEGSPPPAPKHVTAPAARPKRKEAAEGPGTALANRLMQGRAVDSDSEVSRVQVEDERSISPTPSDGLDSQSPTPSPINSPRATPDDNRAGTPGQQKRKRKADDVGNQARRSNPGPTYSSMILDYFVSESSQIPQFLIHPPADFDPNVMIDDDGHTALHWATAMGRIRIVKLLLTAGADIFRANAMGQTALMRSVMFTNNYDLRKFEELFELLHRSTINIDKNDRTVFHYVIDLALQKGKTHAARYYCEVIISRLSEYPTEVADILNFQDEDGETALTLAARARSKRLVKLLLDAGADPKVANKEGKSAEDYILDDERFRAASLGPSGGNGVLAHGLGAYAPQLHHSETAQRASGQAIPAAAEMLEGLAKSFDAELQEKERDLLQAHNLLGNIQAEISESQRTVDVLQQQASAWDESRQNEIKLRRELGTKMARGFRDAYDKASKRDKDAQRGIDVSSLDPASALSKLLRVSNSSKDREKEAKKLLEDLAIMRQQRKDLFEAFIRLQSESGTSAKMAEYRKLIAIGCGIPLAEVDSMIPVLADSLESEPDLAFLQVPADT